MEVARYHCTGEHMALGYPRKSARVSDFRPKARRHVDRCPVDDYPQGYGKIAAIEACDPNFLMYRKFTWLHNRLQLHCQDELVQLERQLEELDKYHFREEPLRLISRRRDDTSPDAKRKELLKTIDTKLSLYRTKLVVYGV